MIKASEKPVTARIMVVCSADQNRSVPSIPHRVCRVAVGEGRTYVGRQPDHTMICQITRTSTIANAFGQIHAHALSGKPEPARA